MESEAKRQRAFWGWAFSVVSLKKIAVFFSKEMICFKTKYVPRFLSHHTVLVRNSLLVRYKAD